MTILRLTGFLGANKAGQPMLLPDGVGVDSRNQKPGRGDFRPWSVPLEVATVPNGQNTIYRMGRTEKVDDRYWLSWPGDVYAVKGFDPTDTTERTYYTGDGAPKVTDNIMGLATPPYPTASRPLAVPAPTVPPLSVETTPGSPTALVETYFYVYTYVTDWGWESAPSPVSNQLDSKSDSTITVSNFGAPPAGNYHITKMRIYRTQASDGGTSEFFFVGEIPIGTLTFLDDKSVLGEVLPTSTWTPPPDNLFQLRAMWNGMLAGISGNTVRFCEPYIPYAWPIQYEVVPPDSTPVALGVFSQSLIVLTTGRPMVFAGSSPDAMDQRVLEMAQACIAPRSVASLGYCVVWASDDGLCSYGVDGPKMLTGGLMLKEDWQKLNPKSIIGCMYEGLYFGSYDDETLAGARKGFFINPGNNSGIFFTDVGYPALHFDTLMDQLYVLVGPSVQKWDAGAAFMLAKMMTKVTHMPRPVVGFACAEVVAEQYPVKFQLYGDGVLRHTENAAGPTPFRLPGGYYAQDWQVYVESMYPVQAVAMANSISELAQT